MNDDTGSMTSFTRGENPLRAEKLNKAIGERISRYGDVMNGPLLLAHDPVQPNEAATKLYVDSHTGPPVGGGGSGGGTGKVGVQINALDYSVIADYSVLPGNVSWNGASVAVGSYVFTSADIGKYLIMPAGGTDGVTTASQPAIVKITGTFASAALVTPPATHSFSGLSFTFGGPGLSPNNITINSPGTKDARVGDVLTAVGGDAIRAGTFYVSQTTVISAASIPANATVSGYITNNVFTVSGVSAGTIFPGGLLQASDIAPGTTIRSQLSGVLGGAGTYKTSATTDSFPETVTIKYGGVGGAPGPVYLRGTTGHGRRVILLGNVLPDGTLDPASLSVYDGGEYWQNIAALETTAPSTNEPMSAAPFAQFMQGSWADNGTTITIGLVHPSLLPYIHLGASVTASSDTDGVVGIAARSVVTAIDPTGTIITIDPPAVGAGTNNDVTFTDNRHPVPFSVTFADNSTTLTFSSTTDVPVLPAAVSVGQVLSGSGLSGIGDPTDVNSTYITAINPARTVITISDATTSNSGGPVSITAIPYLQGVVVNLNFGVSVASYKDWGAYRSAPVAPFSTTGARFDGTPYTTTVTMTAAGSNVAGAAFVHFGTDNAASINAWLAAVRAACNARGVRSIEPIGIEAVLPSGSYLALSTIDGRDLRDGPGLNLKFPGVVIHSAIPLETTGSAAYAWNAIGARSYRIDGEFQIGGNNWFPPDVGFINGLKDTNNLSNNVSIYDMNVNGHFRFAARVFGNTEGFTCYNSGSGNARPPTSALQPNFCNVYDGDNHFGKFPWNPALFASSFEGMSEYGGSAAHQGGGVPWCIHNTGEMRVYEGYAASWAMPSIFWGGGGPANLDIHCETGKLTDTIFIWHPDNPSTGFGGIFRDHALFASNSVFSYDVEGNYGVKVGSFSPGNVEIFVNPQDRSTEIFDNPDALYGGLNYDGDIQIGSVLYTATTHFHNRPDTHTGRTMIGDYSTSYAAKSLTASTIVASKTLVGVKDIQSQTGHVLASLGFQVNDGQGQLPIWASLSRGTLSLGESGIVGAPGITAATVSFHGPGNTSGTATHKIIEHNAGTLDIEGSTVTNANVHVNGTLLADNLIGGITAQTVSTAPGGVVSVAAGTNHIIVSTALTITGIVVGATVIANGYNLWMTFPAGGSFAGQTVAANGVITLKMLSGSWTMVAKVG